MQYVRNGAEKLPHGMMNKVANKYFVVCESAFSELWRTTNEGLALFKILGGNWTLVKKNTNPPKIVRKITKKNHSIPGIPPIVVNDRSLAEFLVCACGRDFFHSWPDPI